MRKVHFGNCKFALLVYIESGNGLAPKRPQVIILTYDGLFYWHIYMHNSVPIQR